MTVLDFVMIGIIGLSGLLAFFRGMLKEFFSLLGWIAGGLAVIFGLPVVRPLLKDSVDLGEYTPIILDVTAGLAIFIVVLTLVAIVSNMISNKVRDSSFGTFDRSLGLLFGLIRGYVLVSAFFVLLNMTFGTDKEPDWLAGAQTKPALAIGGCLLLQLAPESFDQTREKVCSPESGSRRQRDSERETGYTKEQREALDRVIEGSR